MRFPALLAAKIAKTRIAGAFHGAPQDHLLEFLDTSEVLHSRSVHPVSHEKIRHLFNSAAPVIWIAGSEPLEHPGIAHLLRALAPSGKHLFLETNGVFLRRRIHEFQPVPRVFLTVRLDGQPKPDFDLALEGLRAARLSGFFTCVHSLVGESSDLAELQRLHAGFLEIGVDGWMITAEPFGVGARNKAAEARAWLPSAGWRWFSALLECELLAQSRPRESHDILAPNEPQAKSREQGVNIA